MLTIRHYPDPFLRQVAEPVTVIDDELVKLVDEMIETMYEADGVGLAAPQIGVSKRLFIVDMDPEVRKPTVFINPVVKKVGREKEVASEGCLSVPGINANVTRPLEVTLRAQDLTGEVKEYVGTDLQARAFLHENDHLDGILFIDKVSLAAKFSIRHELARLEESFRD